MFESIIIDILDLYKKQRIPIHYVLVVGYDDEEQVVFVHDCSHENVQKIPYDELRNLWMLKCQG